MDLLTTDTKPLYSSVEEAATKLRMDEFDHPKPEPAALSLQLHQPPPAALHQPIQPTLQQGVHHKHLANLASPAVLNRASPQESDSLDPLLLTTLRCGRGRRRKLIYDASKECKECVRLHLLGRLERAKPTPHTVTDAAAAAALPSPQKVATKRLPHGQLLSYGCVSHSKHSIFNGMRRHRHEGQTYINKAAADIDKAVHIIDEAVVAAAESDGAEEELLICVKQTVLAVTCRRALQLWSRFQRRYLSQHHTNVGRNTAGTSRI
ncbi:hypothetical protein CEUSTIGMA_g13423.t1 [Chlamydomonas eustigma]|uniref:Uncharacterized protein n=1 Tax=Chlamydomonas eustigma TaxID=1157962 RepID=A0A250XSF7_9CHLO|nr:hypothetical protein CEUSTIGMA_g13423.t1 [Chlamydomonas eustigma]|eukprot:GAX86007.1 hypothetical protein CEUSTIGMA_g13423.t1 [Chlamydomonas eustigma]